MRLAVCALSAVLLSGCSWLGIGGQQNAGFNLAAALMAQVVAQPSKDLRSKALYNKGLPRKLVVHPVKVAMRFSKALLEVNKASADNNSQDRASDKVLADNNSLVLADNKLQASADNNSRDKALHKVQSPR